MKRISKSKMRQGWARHTLPFKLVCFYAACFTLLCILLYITGYSVLTETVKRKQLKAVTNKALEYREWFKKGDIEQLRQRMDEQSSQADDTLFVRVTGEDFYYQHHIGPTDSATLEEDIRGLSRSVEGEDIWLGDDRWTVAVVTIEDSGLTLQAGKNSKALQRTLAEFRNTTLSFFIPGWLISVIIGSVLTYRFLTPTRNLISTMHDILDSGDFSRRAEIHATSSELNVMVSLFNELLTRNEKLITTMRESLDSVSHDLRTPLSRLRIQAEQALTDQSPSEESYTSALATCSEEAVYIEELLTILMDVAEAESGAMKLNKEEVRVCDLLESAMDLYEFVAEEKQIAMKAECDTSLYIHVDRTRIIQSLANLLDNAIKYSPSDSVVTLRVQAHESTIEIFIADQGEGILESDITHIWNRLYRADQSRTKKGMGLGLSLVKAVVEAHGGSVAVTSEQDKGSEFTLSFPKLT